MKLMCSVEVFNRLSTLASNIGRKKSQRSCLAIGRQSVKSNEIQILLQTATNKIGTKYKVNDNIEKVFTRCIEDGKATIRLKEPPHDINIQCDPIQLKSFLHVLKLGITKKLDPAVLNLSNLNPKSFAVAPKTKFVIKQASDYPTLQGFPRTTKELYLSGLGRKSFDRQILKLQSLVILNLSENQLTNLPQELGTLSNLQELNLANNQLDKCPISKWTWLSGSGITRKLSSLNLSSNQLLTIPDQISKLHALISLNISNNRVSALPQGIGNLIQLKFLNASKNNLKHMPGSMRNLKLTELDVSENPFEIRNPSKMSNYRIRVPSLIDIAAQIVLQTRIYYDASIIPLTLMNYIDKAQYCICGKACFISFIRTFIKMELSSITHSIRFTGTTGDSILFDCYFCSISCVRRYATNI